MQGHHGHQLPHRPARQVNAPTMVPTPVGQGSPGMRESLPGTVINSVVTRQGAAQIKGSCPLRGLQTAGSLQTVHKGYE